MSMGHRVIFSEQNIKHTEDFTAVFGFKESQLLLSHRDTRLIPAALDRTNTLESHPLQK